MEKFIKQLLGSLDTSTFTAAIFFAIIGALVSLLIKSRKRDKLSPATPYKFSFRFLLQDNLQQFLLGCLIAFLAIRFSNDFLGKDLTMWLAVVIGATTNELAGLFEKIEIKARE